MESETGNKERPILLRLKEMAARTGVSIRTLYRDIAEGKLVVVHIRGCTCVEASEFEKYINKGKKKGTV